MEEKYGQIIVEKQNNPLALEDITYRWQGGPVAVLSVDYLGEQWQNDIVHIGPYKLRKVGDFMQFMQCEFVRMDYPFWRVVVFKHHAGRLFRIINSRIIITLAVWNLARFEPHMIPDWGDVHAVRFVRNLFKKG